MSIGFLGLLSLILIIGKVTGYVTLSWFLCFLPVIIGVIGGFLVTAILAYLALSEYK